MRAKRSMLWAAGGVLVAAAFLWALLPRPVLIETAVVVRGTFEQTIEEDGKTRVRERHVVSAPVSGTLQRITLHEGDAIVAGGLLATIVPAPPSLIDARSARELRARIDAASAALAQARASVARARAALDQTRANLARTRELAQQGIAPAEQLERERTQAEVAEREFEAAQSGEHFAVHELDVARAALSAVHDGATRTAWEVRSPVAARVLRVVRESEGAVAVGAPLLEIGDPTRLEVVVDLLTSDAVQVTPGMEVRFDRWGDAATVLGRVRMVEPAAFTKISALGVEEQRVNVIIDVTSPAASWRNVGDGYRVEARILVARRQDAIMVPSSALAQTGERWSAFVVEGARARNRFVELGPRNGHAAVVERGLTPGDRVIVYPTPAVRDGVRVRS